MYISLSLSLYIYIYMLCIFIGQEASSSGSWCLKVSIAMSFCAAAEHGSDSDWEQINTIRCP